MYRYRMSALHVHLSSARHRCCMLSIYLHQGCWWLPHPRVPCEASWMMIWVSSMISLPVSFWWQLDGMTFSPFCPFVKYRIGDGRRYPYVHFCRNGIRDGWDDLLLRPVPSIWMGRFFPRFISSVRTGLGFAPFVHFLGTEKLFPTLLAFLFDWTVWICIDLYFAYKWLYI